MRPVAHFAACIERYAVNIFFCEFRLVMTTKTKFRIGKDQEFIEIRLMCIMTLGTFSSYNRWVYVCALELGFIVAAITKAGDILFEFYPFHAFWMLTISYYVTGTATCL
jgi:hypothetical protein